MTGERERYFYRVRGLKDYLNGRVVELIAPIEQPDDHLTRVYLTPEEFNRIRMGQDL